MNNPFAYYNQFNIGILEDTIDNSLLNFKELLKKGSVAVEEIEAVDFRAVCKTPDLEYTPTESRFLLYEPESNINTTVFFPNLSDGWHTAIYNYTRLFNKNAYLLGFTVREGRFQSAYQFKFFKKVNADVEQRTVYVMKEDRWVFYEQSQPLSIEDTSNYLKKKKEDRLNKDIILNYLNKAGYDLTADSFYKTNKRAALLKYKPSAANKN